MTVFPADLAVRLDGRVRVLSSGRVLIGGEPTRIMRLSAAGAHAVQRMQRMGPGSGDAARALARTLVDGGLAHPCPKPTPTPTGEVTVVIPVRDRAELLDQCLRRVHAPVVVDDGSRDGSAVAAVCATHGARLVCRARSGGPAAARNTGLALVDTPLVAFVDSDCLPPDGWLEALAGHFADPRVAAVAPRIRPAPVAAAGPVSAFAAERSPLDLGGHASRVVPMGRVSYVPTATLIVRRSALRGGFDDALRFGEDVDLVWRLHEQGATVRYDPRVCVLHREPSRLTDLLKRHYHYGTSAASLARRHPGLLTPLVIEPYAAIPAMCLLSGRPRSAAAIVALESLMALRRARAAGVDGWQPATWPTRGVVHIILGSGHAMAMLAPAALAMMAVRRRTRAAALLLACAPPLVEWASRRPALDPVRWTALCLADDAAYGLGVWAGSIRRRTLGALRPTVRWRAGRATRDVKRRSRCDERTGHAA